MSVHALKPWTDFTTLHPDVERGVLTEATFAIDLGAVAARDKNVPVVYRDPEAFFRATYLTADLRRLLDEILAALGGRADLNRVLKLRTPFGGGKSHTLAALLHAARDRAALDAVPEARGLADPGEVAWAVFDGEKFDARDGKQVAGGRTIRTMWGWLAWQIDPERAFPLVEGHDRDRVAPGGDVIREVLTTGAGGRAVLILLDEVLKYVARARGVAVHESSLEQQTKDFFQNLTVEVAGSSRAALVYSLTWSAREALGDMALLEEIDKLAGRVDQLREPVGGDEILPILQRRLLGGVPDATAAGEVATAYADAFGGLRRASAETDVERQVVEDAAEAFRKRLRAAYPFHPALIDVMRERWAAVEHFQRTRGALRFLAACLRACKKPEGRPHPVLGPGDVLLDDPEVRLALQKEVDPQGAYDAVLAADIVGPNARTKEIDERLARESSRMSSVRPAQRIATAIFLCSFGGLRRTTGGQVNETLPPGIAEGELLEAVIGPELDRLTASNILSQLRTRCLYLHFDGSRYCFKTDPNVTMLVEEAEQEVSREEIRRGEEGPVRTRIKELLDQKLAGRHEAIVWPATSHDIDDQVPTFRYAYLPLEFAQLGLAEQERRAVELLSKYGDRPRQYRNGLGLVVPSARPVESLRRAVRYQIAVKRVQDKRQTHQLTRSQLDQLMERERTETSATDSAFRELYAAVWLPYVEDGQVRVNKVERGGTPLQANDIHGRVVELLTAVGTPKVYSTLTPAKVRERVRLGEVLGEGESRVLGVTLAEVEKAFFTVMQPPRLTSRQAIEAAVVEGVERGFFGYTAGPPPALGADGRYQLSHDRVIFKARLPEADVDFDSGFLLHPDAVPAPAPVLGDQATFTTTIDTGDKPGDEGTEDEKTGSAPGERRRRVSLRFGATRDQLYRAYDALANLADMADDGRLGIHLEAIREEGFDATWLRNAVEEPLDEAGIEIEKGEP